MSYSNGWVILAVVSSFLLGSLLSFGMGYKKGVHAGVVMVVEGLGMELEKLEEINDDEEDKV